MWLANKNERDNPSVVETLCQCGGRRGNCACVIMDVAVETV